MICHINYHPRFHKQCERLKKSNDKAGKAVDNAMVILSALRQSRRDFSAIGPMTHSGELRLKDAIKYSLGNSYRLVLSIGQDCVFVLFIGTHDDCDKWLERNRGADDFNFLQQEKILMPSGTPYIPQNPGVADKGEGFSLSIEDRLLRRVFQGICNTGG